MVCIVYPSLLFQYAFLPSSWQTTDLCKAMCLQLTEKLSYIGTKPQTKRWSESNAIVRSITVYMHYTWDKD